MAKDSLFLFKVEMIVLTWEEVVGTRMHDGRRRPQSEDQYSDWSVE